VSYTAGKAALVQPSGSLTRPGDLGWTFAEGRPTAGLQGLWYDAQGSYGS